MRTEPELHPASSLKEREKEDKRERGERERKEREMVREGEHVYFFCAVVKVISNPLVNNLRALDKASVTYKHTY